MDSEEFSKKAKEFFSKSAKASKEAFEKAGTKVQDFTDKSVTKFEIKQLENKIKDKYSELGNEIFSAIGDKQKIIINDEVINEKVKTLKLEIENLKKQIKQKEETIEK